MAETRHNNPLARFLEPDERIFWWRERPTYRFSLPALVPVAFSICWTLVTFVAFWQTSLAMIYEMPGALWMKPAASLFLTLIGVGMTIYSWQDVRTRVPMTYLVTNKAALIIEHTEPPRVERFGPDAIARRMCFEDRIAFVDDVFDPRAHDKRSSFIGIDDIEVADKALDRIARKIEKTDEGDDFF